MRETAGEAFEAWLEWDGKGPEPTVQYETNYEPRQISISQACGLVWNCTDIVPGDLFDYLRSDLEQYYGINIKTRTYAGCARAIIHAIKQKHAA